MYVDTPVSSLQSRSMAVGCGLGLQDYIVHYINAESSGGSQVALLKTPFKPNLNDLLCSSCSLDHGRVPPLELPV
jgi:hypothetical protein